MSVPTTRSEIFTAERDILSNQLRIFKVQPCPTSHHRPHVFDLCQFFLEVLRDPEAARFLETEQPLHGTDIEPRETGPQSTGDQVVTVHHDLDTRAPDAAELEVDNPDVVYEFTPPRAALYAETVEGFGKWKVNVTDNANSQLRKLRKKSPETLRLVEAKIK